jgi:hypothetical protein
MFGKFFKVCSSLLIIGLVGGEHCFRAIAVAWILEE